MQIILWDEEMLTLWNWDIFYQRKISLMLHACNSISKINHFVVMVKKIIIIINVGLFMHPTAWSSSSPRCASGQTCPICARTSACEWSVWSATLRFPPSSSASSSPSLPPCSAAQRALRLRPLRHASPAAGSTDGCPVTPPTFSSSAGRSLSTPKVGRQTSTPSIVGHCRERCFLAADLCEGLPPW